MVCNGICRGSHLNLCWGFSAGMLCRNTRILIFSFHEHIHIEAVRKRGFLHGYLTLSGNNSARVRLCVHQLNRQQHQQHWSQNTARPHPVSHQRPTKHTTLKTQTLSRLINPRTERQHPSNPDKMQTHTGEPLHKPVLLHTDICGRYERYLIINSTHTKVTFFLFIFLN